MKYTISPKHKWNLNYELKIHSAQEIRKVLCFPPSIPGALKNEMSFDWL